MENDAATLYCPNENCQAANPLTHKFCQRCSTPLPKNYLWAVVDDLSLGSPGKILADRYLIIDKFVLLDTKPGLLTLTPELDNLHIPRAYLRLIPYRLHVPQVHGVLTLANDSSQPEILLLEKPPLLVDDTTQQLHLASELITAWGDATSMRQLNWLWQIAHLWQPLA
jgi:protein phosphatase